MTPSLERDLTLRLGGAIAAVGVLIGLCAFAVSTWQEEAEFVRYSEGRADEQVRRLVGLLWNLDEVATEDLGHTLLQDREIDHVLVVDTTTGEVVFEQGDRQSPLQLTVSRPVIRSGEPIGHLELTFSRELLWRRIMDTLVAIGLVVLATVAASLAVVRRVFRRPLHVLADVMQGVERLKVYLARLLNSQPGALFLLTPEGVVENVTTRAAELLGSPGQELVGRPLGALLVGGESFRDGGLRRVIEEGEVEDLPLIFAAGDGRRLPIRVGGSVVRDPEDRPLAVILFARGRADVRRPQLDGYEVLRLLGSGGMAWVWLARHRDSGTLRAVKVLLEPSPRLEDRLRAEGELRLRHDNVVRVIDVVDAGGVPALILEHVDGPSLAELLDTGVALSIAEIDALGRGMLAGVAAAHREGWVHRDLKPSNVLLSVTDRALVPKVADFGLAKVLQRDETVAAGDTTRAGPGTRRYMSLEQLSGAAADPSMDVFSLGAVLFELIEGQRAFATQRAWEDAFRRGHGPELTRSGVPARMRDAVAAALSDRDSRPADATALMALWSDGTALPRRPFRRSTLARWCEVLLPDEVLLAGELSAAEERHLATCAKCRVRARLLARLDEAAATAPTEE